MGARSGTGLDESRSLLRNHWAADICGFSLGSHRTCLSLLEGGVAVEGLRLWLSIGELVPDGLAFFKDVLVLQLQFLQWQRSIVKGHLHYQD